MAKVVISIQTGSSSSEHFLEPVLWVVAVPPH
jgi:hypothetical protein